MKYIKAFPSQRHSFIHHDFSGILLNNTRAPPCNATGDEVGLELATDGIQFYVFANLAM